jgi:hypothetical protein
MSVEAVRKESIIEYLTSLSKPLPQHFVDKFDGDILDSNRWTFINIFGAAGSSSMLDGINNGFQITSGAAINARSGIKFGDIRQYDNDGSRIIQYSKAISGTANIMNGGLSATSQVDAGSSNMNGIAYRRITTTGFYDFFTSNGATATAISTSVAIDLLQHRFQLDITSTAGYISIDGILEGTITLTLPTSGMQPFFASFTAAANAAVASIQYCEAFNY